MSLRKTITTTFLFTITIVFSQNKIAFSKLTKNESGDYMYNNALYSGESLLLWPSNNKPLQRITWSNGKIDGSFKSWYENGKQNQDIEYKDGVRHGIFKTYYQNGSPEVH